MGKGSNRGMKRNRKKDGGGGGNGWTHVEQEARMETRFKSSLKREKKRKKKREIGRGGDEKSLDTMTNDVSDHGNTVNTEISSIGVGVGGGGVVVGGYKRMALAHDSYEKRQYGKLQLHITKMRRQVDKMRQRLMNWDDLEEGEEEEGAKKKQREEAEERKRKGRAAKDDEEEDDRPTDRKRRRKKRPGPETWKLRGPARPAWEVYDFDVRYQCPHERAMREAREKAKRVRNVLTLYKGRFGEEKPRDDNDNDNNDDDDGPPQPYCRQYLASLMQLGLLNLEAKKYKAARTAFSECMELDGTDHPITDARCKLMRMYLEANRPDSARRLWERLPHDTSVWIRYSAALIEYASWKLLKEEGSTKQSAQSLLVKACRANVFCAYYLAYHKTFESVMEYTDEIEDADEGTLEEAIEYCSSEQMGMWLGTEGAIHWIRRTLLRVRNQSIDCSFQVGNDVAGDGSGAGARAGAGAGAHTLTDADLDWNAKLTKIEKDYEASCTAGEMGKKDNDDVNEKVEDEEKEDDHDLLMYAGMFRTAMEMLQDVGEFNKYVEESDDEEEEKEGDEAQEEVMISDQDSDEEGVPAPLDDEEDGSKGDSDEEDQSFEESIMME